MIRKFRNEDLEQIMPVSYTHLGEETELHYDPEKPEKFWCERDTKMMKLLCGIFMGIGGIFLVLGIVFMVCLLYTSREGFTPVQTAVFSIRVKMHTAFFHDSS